MKPYSLDFRQKILEIHNKEKLSIRNLAQRFGVAKSFIQKLLKQHRETGDIKPLSWCAFPRSGNPTGVAPQRQGGSPPRKLRVEQLIDLVEIIETTNDATLVELCDLLEKKTHIRVSRATMGRLVKQLDYTF